MCSKGFGARHVLQLLGLYMHIIKHLLNQRKEKSTQKYASLCTSCMPLVYTKLFSYSYLLYVFYFSIYCVFVSPKQRNGNDSWISIMYVLRHNKNIDYVGKLNVYASIFFKKKCKMYPCFYF